MAKNTVTQERLDKYFNVTAEGLAKARAAMGDQPEAKEFYDMAQRYYEDAKYFAKKGEHVTAFAALNYAHGWLDAGARLRFFKVTDSRLFTVDETDTERD